MKPTKKASGFFKYGVLTLPLIIMLPFGLLGSRPGQLFNKIIGYIINLIFLFNFGLVFVIMVGYLYADKDYNQTYIKFYAGFVLFVTIKFTLLAYNFYKKYNVISLIEDVTCLRKHDFSRLDVGLVLFTFTGVVTMVIYTFVTILHNLVLPMLQNRLYLPFAFIASDPTTIKIIVVFENGFYLTFAWTSVLATSFLINVMAAVLKKEFHKCIENLQEKINETGTLSSDTFSETMERFGDLRNMVQKVDDMFSPIVCLNLAISLGMLCGAIYALARGEGTFFDGWHFLVLTSLGTLVIILVQVPELHNKVRPNLISYKSIFQVMASIPAH